MYRLCPSIINIIKAASIRKRCTCHAGVLAQDVEGEIVGGDDKHGRPSGGDQDEGGARKGVVVVRGQVCACSQTQGMKRDAAETSRDAAKVT